ncbi:2-dehydropantoate 2-reductase [Heliobacterium chlorum]|uniref:2-dehydropantoate 2-reductase n=1 Tax=Heliobacterium chlorum TaxID=2698 RepID=A0ABR7T6I2_HELCL|nr:2-dehydropantoate 2-reductase [Heliobacterium chlorum]MBC9785692.1 2-dehydropantoate 2-reductase [Heliobacterium chlorum]
MHFLIYGLGAIGTVYGAMLKAAGHKVTGLARPAMLEKISQKGLQVCGIWGEYAQAPDRLISSLDEAQDRDWDMIILTVKSYATAEAARDIARLRPPECLLWLAQNGYGNFEAAAPYIPEDKILLGRIIFGAETQSPGVSKVTVIADDVVIGSPKNHIPLPVAEKWAAIFRESGIPTRASEDVMKYIWGKIIYNSALNSLGAILEVNYGKLAGMDGSHELMIHVVREIFAVLEAIGQKTHWADADAYIADFYSKLIPSTRYHHASMLQDIQHSRHTEIDSLNGAVVALGRMYGVPTPVNETITLLVKAKEQLVTSVA